MEDQGGDNGAEMPPPRGANWTTDGGTVAVSALNMVRTWYAGRGCKRVDKALTATRLMWPMAVASPHKTQSKRIETEWR